LLGHGIDTATPVIGLVIAPACAFPVGGLE
jgi:hypothetical protein